METTKKTPTIEALLAMTHGELVDEIIRMREHCIEALVGGPGDRTTRYAMRAALKIEDGSELHDRELVLAVSHGFEPDEKILLSTLSPSVKAEFAHVIYEYDSFFA